MTIQNQVENPISRNCPVAHDTKFCVHHRPFKPAQACYGDSGGPLILNAGGYGVVVGVASYIQCPDCPPDDYKCLQNAICNKNDVSVYTNIQPFLPWIKSITGEGKRIALSFL